MGTGYVRNDTGNNIADGNVINASDLDGEFDALVSAFNSGTGHDHDGTSANGKPITKVGPTQDVEIAATAVTPKVDNTVDLGSSSFEFKDLYIDGTANIDSLVADTADINAGTIDGVTIGTNSAVTDLRVDNIKIDANTISSTDTNGNITLAPDGSGRVQVAGTSANAGGIEFFEDTDNGTNKALLTAPASLGADVTLTLPATTSTLGFINAPAVGTKTAAYTLATSDVGKYVQVGSGGSIEIPDGTFAEGDVVSVFNNTSSGITITCSITTAYIAGEDSDKASVSLETRGVATILFISSTVCVIVGNVS